MHMPVLRSFVPLHGLPISVRFALPFISLRAPAQPLQALTAIKASYISTWIEKPGCARIGASGLWCTSQGGSGRNAGYAHPYYCAGIGRNARAIACRGGVRKRRGSGQYTAFTEMPQILCVNRQRHSCVGIALERMQSCMRKGFREIACWGAEQKRVRGTAERDCNQAVAHKSRKTVATLFTGHQ